MLQHFSLKENLRARHHSFVGTACEMDGRVLFFVALLVVARPPVVASSKLLGIPFPTGASHYFNMLKLLNELGERGHDVAILTPKDAVEWSKKADNKRVQFIFYGNLDAIAHDRFEGNDIKLEEIGRFGVDMIKAAIEDTNVLNALRSFGPELVIMDATLAPAVLLTEILGLPAVGLFHAAPAEPCLEMYNLPSSLSFVPQFLTGLNPNVEWSFFDRLKNLAAYVGFSGLVRYINRPVEALVAEYQLPPYKRMLQKVLMILVASDFAVDAPSLVPPHIQYVGPLTPEPPKPLPADLEEFVAGAGERGVVLVSFGTVVKVGSSHLLSSIADVLKDLPCRAIWRIREGAEALNATELGSHVLVSDWVPQNDLLGHANIKAFVTHGGHNSVMEAAYHGVPIVAMPFFADQFDSAGRAVHNGFGLVVHNGKGFEAALSESIIRITSEEEFSEQAQKVSHRMRKHKRRGVEVASDWVEHVLATDMEMYLAPRIGHLSWFELRMLDCYAFIFCCFAAIAMAVAMGVKYCARQTYGLLSRRRHGVGSQGPQRKKEN